MAEGMITKSCLHHKAEMVIFEAARAITELSNIKSLESTPAVIALQLLLSSYKPGLRFAAVQALNKVERFYYKFFFLGVCCTVYVMTIPFTFYQRFHFLIL